MGRVAIPLARPRPRGYQPSSPAPEQNPPQSVSGSIPYAERIHEAIRMLATSGYRMADLLARPAPIGDSSDGIRPCGYDAL